MLAFPNELRTLSADDLMELVEAYLVRSHDGTPYQGPQQPDRIISFILNWTRPDSGPVQENRFLEAIQNGVRFNAEAVTDQDQSNDLLKAIFGDKLTVSP